MSLQKTTIKLNEKLKGGKLLPQLINILNKSSYPFIGRYQYGYSLHAISSQVNPSFYVESIDLDAHTANVTLNEGFEIPVEALNDYNLTFMELNNGHKGFVIVKDLHLIELDLSSITKKSYSSEVDMEVYTMVNALSVISNERNFQAGGFGRFVATTKTKLGKYFVFAINCVADIGGNTFSTPNFFVLKGDFVSLSGNKEDLEKLTPLHEINDPEFFNGKTYVFRKYIYGASPLIDDTSTAPIKEITLHVKELTEGANVSALNKLDTIQESSSILIQSPSGSYQATIAEYDPANNQIKLLVPCIKNIELEINKHIPNGKLFASAIPTYTLNATSENIEKCRWYSFDKLQLIGLTLESVDNSSPIDENTAEEDIIE